MLFPEDNGGLNFCFADGHAKWLKSQAFVQSYNSPQLSWLPYQATDNSAEMRRGPDMGRAAAFVGTR